MSENLNDENLNDENLNDENSTDKNLIRKFHTSSGYAYIDYDALENKPSIVSSIETITNEETEKTEYLLSFATASDAKNGIPMMEKTIEYTSSKSGTKIPTIGWSEKIPEVELDHFLWTRFGFPLEDGKVTYGYTVSRQGGNPKITNLGMENVAPGSIETEKIKENAISNVITFTVPTTGWSNEYPYTNTVTITGVGKNYTYIVDVNCTDGDWSNNERLVDEFSKVIDIRNKKEDTLTFYCTSKFAKSMNLKVLVIKR